MKILITGGGGFIGRHVVARLLARGYDIRHVGRSPQPELQQLGVETIEADLADAPAIVEAAAGVDAVFHIAAKAGVWGARESFVRANIEGTQNILHACRQHGIRHLVYTSTPSVVFNRQSFRGEDESLPYGSRWLCHYAQTKAVAEAAVLAANTTNRLHTIALRPHLVWGPGDPHILPRVLAQARAGRLRIVGEGRNRVDIAYVENVADAHINALDAIIEGRGCGRPYFISQGDPVELWPWINDVLEQMRVEPLRRRISFRAAYSIGATAEAIWKLGRLKGEPPMTRFVATELAKDHFFDISAARRDLHYTPAISMEEGLRKTIADLKRRGC